MSKKNILILVIAAAAVVVGLVYWQANKKDISVLEVLKIIGEGENKIDWDNPDEMFSLKAPDDFDANRLERLEEKITVSKNLYQTKKDDTWTWITIGNMYEFAHDYDRAIGAYEKAASLNELEYISRMNLGYLYENQKKDYAKAEEYYKKVIEINGTNPEQYVNLARLYEFKTNQSAEAEIIYLTGLEKTGNNPDLLVAFIRFYERQNNTEKVAQYAKLLLKLYPDNAAYQNDFGAVAK